MSTKHRWIPLENNPEVLNSWAHAAGLGKSEAQFEDVYGLDSELLAMVSQPVKAIILLFPLSDTIMAKQTEEEKKIAAEGQPDINPSILWIKQTISNACGTMGLLHALANSNVTIAPESPLAKFIAECKGKTPTERAKLLETTPLFANIHADAAAAGQTSVPENLDTDLHFTCFVQAPEPGPRQTATSTKTMRLIELDGRRAGPVDRGVCTDLLRDVAKIVKDVYVSQVSSMHFSMMSLGPPA